MRISHEQVARFRELKVTEFLRQCAASLRMLFPTETSRLSEKQLTEHVASLVERLGSFGLDHTGDLEQGVHWLFAFQNTAAPVIPKYLLAQLEAPHVSVEKKIEILEQLVIFDNVTLPPDSLEQSPDSACCSECGRK